MAVFARFHFLKSKNPISGHNQARLTSGDPQNKLLLMIKFSPFLLCFTLFYSVLLCFTLFYSVLLCFTVLLCFPLFYSVFLCFTLRSQDSAQCPSKTIMHYYTYICLHVGCSFIFYFYKYSYRYWSRFLSKFLIIFETHLIRYSVILYILL